MVGLATERVGQAVVGHIHNQKDIQAADRLQNRALCFTGTKSRNGSLYDIRIALVAGKCDVVIVFGIALISPLDEIVVDFGAQFFTTFKRNDT